MENSIKNNSNLEVCIKSSDKEEGICPVITQSLLIKLKPSEIIYFENSGGRTLIEMQDGREYQTRQKIDFFRACVDQDFFNVGRYLINLSKIVSIDSKAVVCFENGKRIYLTKKNYVGLKQRFANYMLNSVNAKGELGLKII